MLLRFWCVSKILITLLSALNLYHNFIDFSFSKISLIYLFLKMCRFKKRKVISLTLHWSISIEYCVPQSSSSSTGSGSAGLYLDAYEVSFPLEENAERPPAYHLNQGQQMIDGTPSVLLLEPLHFCFLSKKAFPSPIGELWGNYNNSSTYVRIKYLNIFFSLSFPSFLIIDASASPCIFPPLSPLSLVFAF